MSLTRPRRSPRRIAIAVRRLLAVGAVAVSACRQSGSSAHAATRITAAPVLTEAEVRDRDIEFYRDRAAADPTGAADLARLGSLYLQRSRETGDPRDAVRAEDASRRSLRNRRAHNDQAA